MEENRKLGARKWVSFLLVGLIGQLAWAIENNYINLWVYSQSGRADFINWMTISSAIVATLTTFLMGALSDKLGKRKLFIALGYTIWGVFVFAFGLCSLGNMEAMFGDDGSALLAVGVSNVIVDCVMTFFGSTGNDACFNAMVTEQTNEKNRPFVEAVLSVLPLLAMILMMGIGKIFGIGEANWPNPITAEYASSVARGWLYFFLVCGALTTVVGIVSFFLLPRDNVSPETRSQRYWQNLVYGFRPSSIKANRRFYLALLSFLFFAIATDSFMPYYMVYFQGIEGLNFLGAMAIILAVSATGAILVGAFLEKIGHLKLLLPSILTMGLGALLLFFSSQSWSIVIAGCLLMLGYLIGVTVLGAELRDDTPVDKVGSLQGVRMVFAVMLPMIIGSEASSLVFQTEKTDAYGQLTKVPDKWMFLMTLGACALALIPAIFLLRSGKKKEAEAKIGE